MIRVAIFKLVGIETMALSLDISATGFDTQKI